MTDPIATERLLFSEIFARPVMLEFDQRQGSSDGGAVLLKAESVIARHAPRLPHRARLVTIDLDPADDPTHGAQQLSFFNSHYDNACYLPMMGFVTFNHEAEQYLCAAVLRPGNVTAAAGAVGIVRRLMALVRKSFPKARIRVRLDGGFANPELLAFLDAEAGVEYVVAMASNAVLTRKAEDAMQ